MKRDVLFGAMDVIKEMDKLNEQISSKTNEKMSDEVKQGYEYAKSLLDILLNQSIEDAGESCVAHINELEEQEEMFKSDIFKYLDKNGGKLVEVK